MLFRAPSLIVSLEQFVNVARSSAESSSLFQCIVFSDGSRTLVPAKKTIQNYLYVLYFNKNISGRKIGKKLNSEFIILVIPEK